MATGREIAAWALFAVGALLIVIAILWLIYFFCNRRNKLKKQYKAAVRSNSFEVEYMKGGTAKSNNVHTVSPEHVIVTTSKRNGTGRLHSSSSAMSTERRHQKHIMSKQRHPRTRSEAYGHHGHGRTTSASHSHMGGGAALRPYGSETQLYKLNPGVDRHGHKQIVLQQVPQQHRVHSWVLGHSREFSPNHEISADPVVTKATSDLLDVPDSRSLRPASVAHSTHSLNCRTDPPGEKVWARWSPSMRRKTQSNYDTNRDRIDSRTSHNSHHSQHSQHSYHVATETLNKPRPGAPLSPIHADIYL